MLILLLTTYMSKYSAWYGDMTDYPGSTIADTASLHRLIQIIDQPTNFEPNKTPSCINLICFHCNPV